MKNKRIVLALGGNALGKNPEEQKALIKDNVPVIAGLIKDGHDVIITHGNGPQVGMINLAFASGEVPVMPFPECGAMSQGYIGYHLQNALDAEFEKMGLDKRAVAIVTQVVVDADDPAFQNPTKPIGSFYSEEEANAIAKERGYTMKEDAGRGWRRVVPSPKPSDIVEKKALKDLLDNGNIVIASGGGGIPVVKREVGYEGVPAVIDKDFAGALLAELVEADTFLVLTAVEKVAIRFNKPDEEWLSELDVATAEKYMADGEFGKGSMEPKVQAAIGFVKGHPERTAIITALEKCQEALDGKTGTVIRDK